MSEFPSEISLDAQAILNADGYGTPELFNDAVTKAAIAFTDYAIEKDLPPYITLTALVRATACLMVGTHGEQAKSGVVPFVMQLTADIQTALNSDQPEQEPSVEA